MSFKVCIISPFKMLPQTPLYLLILCVLFGNGLSEKSDQRIKGPGRNMASSNEFKFLVKIKNKETNKLIGSGVLITPKVVLAIGFNYGNMKPSEVKVVLGEYDRKDDDLSQAINVDTIKFHPELSQSNGTYGHVSLFKLSKKPKIGNRFLVETFGLKNIVSSKKDKEIFGNSEKCIVPGYGSTELDEDTEKLPRKMQKFVPQIKKQDKCTKYINNYLKQKYICSINDDFTAVCLKDGGSPLLCKKGGKMKLYGLTFAAKEIAGQEFRPCHMKKETHCYRVSNIHYLVALIPSEGIPFLQIFEFTVELTCK